MNKNLLRKKAKSIILNSKWNLLICRYKGIWSNKIANRGIPWWWIENFESYKQWAYREIFEEVGIQYFNIKLVHTFKWFLYHYYNQEWREWLIKNKNRYYIWEKIRFYILYYDWLRNKINLNFNNEFDKYMRINPNRLKYNINQNYYYYLKLQSYEKIIKIIYEKIKRFL